MIQYTQGNLLDADVEAVVNTVNTVGVMGKGIALMFKERFPQNMSAYAKACKAEEVTTGKMFVTQTGELIGLKWVVNFPTKKHWRNPSKMEWIISGLEDLKRFIVENDVQSIAIPPLGAGNGKLQWAEVKPHIERILSDLGDVEVIVYEPVDKYQNVEKRKGVKKLTPARAMIAELVRRYSVLGMECSLLEIQKLAWFLERIIERESPDNPLDLRFEANRYGPYADRLRHLLDGLDGSYLHCDKRISDASPLDVIWFEDKKKAFLQAYLKSHEMKPYMESFEKTCKLVDGFESPFALELLATVDWLLVKDKVDSSVDSIKQGLSNWMNGSDAAKRKSSLFDSRVITIALERINQYSLAV